MKKKFSELTKKEQKEAWLKSFKKIKKNNAEIYIRRLAEMSLPNYAQVHFDPLEQAYIQKIFKQYMVDYVGELIKVLVERKKK